MLSFSNQVSFLAAFAVVYGLYDLRCGDQTTLFMATAYNAFQVEAFSFHLSFPEAGLEFGSFLGHLCMHKGTKSPCTSLTYEVMSGLWGSGQWFPCLVCLCSPLPPHLLLLSHPHGDHRHVWTLRLVLPTWCKFFLIKMASTINVNVPDHHVERGDVLHWRTPHLPLRSGHLCPRLWNSFHKSGEDFGE